MADSTVRYLDSSGKKFYRSSFIPVSSTGAVEIPLRGSERQGWTSAPHWNRHSDNSGKNKPAGPKRGLHEIPPKVMYMSNAYKGHTVMIDRDVFEEMTGIEVGFA